MKRYITNTITAKVGDKITVVSGNPEDVNGAKLTEARVIAVVDNGYNKSLTCVNSKGFMYYVAQLSRYNNLYYCTSAFPWNDKYIPSMESKIGCSVSEWFNYDYSDYKIISENIDTEEELDILLKAFVKEC